MTTLSLHRDGSFRKPDRGSAGSRILAFAEGGHGRAAFLLVLVCLACFLPGLVSLQPMDRDEPRYAQATKQMIETGDFVDIRFQDEARHKKPVGIYWMQSAAVATAQALGLDEARTTIAVYRVPSFLGATAATLLAYWAALALARRREAFLAAALIGASVILMVEARLAKTDAVLLACSVATMGALARAWMAQGTVRLPRRVFLAFWLGIGIGVLVKGPLVLLFAGLPAVALSLHARSLRWLVPLRPVSGIALALAIAAPWFVLIAMRSGADFFAASAGQDLMGKVGTAQTYHWAPPGFYLVAFFATFWPGALMAAIGAEFVWINRRVREAAFLVAWVVPAWIALELVPTKLPHYVMPLYPALAIAAALGIGHGFVGPFRRRFRIFGFLLALVPVGLLIGLPIAAYTLGDRLGVAAIAVLAVAAGIALVSWRLWATARVEDAAIAGIVSAMALSIAVFGVAQRDLEALKLSPNLASAVERALACETPRVGTLGYREPSLVFLAGTDLVMLDAPADAAAFLAEGACRAVLVTDAFEVGFGQALAQAGIGAVQAERVIGFNINGGDPLGIGVYVRSADTGEAAR
ncbi:ArnT family glycosyltransferase [Salinarimonas ramus]|uniref:Glycosyl transferase n=1 Tax=Salinarimonas ramus TaxID=690164 RepID=A0A917QK96_9HYPH|nr:glycosyltransferase family 39 protein [Salinarimonas ramus]GGK54415.1 glycosyl transferase [Salinarimonas ramus]